eukprot:3008490-Rhodomonas_salina.1
MAANEVCNETADEDVTESEDLQTSSTEILKASLRLSKTDAGSSKPVAQSVANKLPDFKIKATWNQWKNKRHARGRVHSATRGTALRGSQQISTRNDFPAVGVNFGKRSE